MVKTCSTPSGNMFYATDTRRLSSARTHATARRSRNGRRQAVTATNQLVLCERACSIAERVLAVVISVSAVAAWCGSPIEAVDPTPDPIGEQYFTMQSNDRSANDPNAVSECASYP